MSGRCRATALLRGPETMETRNKDHGERAAQKGNSWAAHMGFVLKW